ncbi:MAG: squalene--hopene cyclase, partial [Pseudomonadota bacterium]
MQKSNRSVEQAPSFECIKHGAQFLASLQGEDGSWRADYGGPMFLLPMYIAACSIAGRKIPDARCEGMKRYFAHVQNSDGSVGLHVQAPGCMFTTALSYVALRLVGVFPEDETATKMRRWIHANGTPLGAASWGKFVLSLLNLYEYSGLNPILPELWLMPRSAPMHPSRLWCHCRQVYLPMAYLYGIKAKKSEDDLIIALRSELYNEDYEKILFEKKRDFVSPFDNHVPITKEMQVLNRALVGYER